MLPADRIAYFIVAVFFLVNRLGTEYVGAVPILIMVLKLASAVALCEVLILAVAFARIRSFVFRITAPVRQILFVRYAGLSPAAPFYDVPAEPDCRWHPLRGTVRLVLHSAICQHHVPKILTFRLRL